MPANAIWILFVFIAYFAVLIGIAVVRSRHMDDMSDYVLGGRKMGYVTSALSAASSATSGWTMLVLPALAFAAGMMHLWTVVSIILGHWFAWTILGKRIRRYTLAAENSLTLPEFLEKRFGDTSGLLRSLSGLIGIYFITLYVCSGLIAGAKLLEVVFGLDHMAHGHNIGVVISLIAVVSYTFIGGFLAVSRTDVFQSVIMLAGFIIIPVTLILTINNPFHGLESTAPGFWNPFTDQNNSQLGILFFFSSVGWGLGALGAHRIISRFMAVQREGDMKRSRNVGSVWVVLIFLFALLMGLVAAPALLDRGIALPDAEKLYLVVAETFFHPIVAGLLLTAVIAAVMSTADSQLLLASAIATDDLPIIKRIAYAMRTQSRVWMGRSMLLLVGVIAALISIVSPESVYALVSLAWGGMGAAFGPALIMGLYWRRFNRWGALAAVVTGSVVSTWWWLAGLGYEKYSTLADLLGFEATVDQMEALGVWQINPGVPGFVAALILGVAVTLLTAPPPDEITDLYDRVNGPDWDEENETASQPQQA
ncbi:MAG: sodium/proline symporter [Chloroflexi bacterium]|nr:sodium/proline symporter [Chloroflexota bacterium]